MVDRRFQFDSRDRNSGVGRFRTCGWRAGPSLLIASLLIGLLLMGLPLSGCGNSPHTDFPPDGDRGAAISRVPQAADSAAPSLAGKAQQAKSATAGLSTESDLPHDSPPGAGPASVDPAAGVVGRDTAAVNEQADAGGLPASQSPFGGEGGEEIRIASFDDLSIGMQSDMVFRPFLLRNRAVERLLGKRVHLGGYIYPGDSATGMKEFILLKNTECKFGPGGVADHLILVKMQGTATAEYTNKVVYVEGTLVLNPVQGPDGNTWSIYDLHCERVTLHPRR